MAEHSFQIGPIHEEDIQGKMLGEAVAVCLLAVEPPTGFVPSFLTETLKDPNHLQSRRQMMRPLIATVESVSTTEQRTVFKVTANSLSNTPGQRLHAVINALGSIINAEDKPLDSLEETIAEARDYLFKTKEGE